MNFSSFLELSILGTWSLTLSAVCLLPTKTNSKQTAHPEITDLVFGRLYDGLCDFVPFEFSSQISFHSFCHCSVKPFEFLLLSRVSSVSEMLCQFALSDPFLHCGQKGF